MQQASNNTLIPFIAPKEGKTYTIWEILWLSCYFPKPEIIRRAKVNNYGPCGRTIRRWFPKEREKIFKEDAIRKLLRKDEVGSREWLTKIKILSKCGYAPREDVLLSMFNVNIQPLPQQIMLQQQDRQQLQLPSPPSRPPSSPLLLTQTQQPQTQQPQTQQPQTHQLQECRSSQKQPKQTKKNQPQHQHQSNKKCCNLLCPKHKHQRQQQQKQHHQTNNLSSPGPISCRTRLKRLKLKESTNKVSTKAKQPRRSKRILSHPKQQERARPVTKVYFRSKTLQSIIEREGLDKAVNKVLSDLFLHPFRKPSVGGMEGIVISFNSAYGNPVRSNIDRYTYGRQSYSLSHCDNQQRRRSDRHCTTRYAYVYGAGSGASSFGDSSTQMVCREMSTEMKLIRSKLQEIMEETFAGDETVNTGVNLNTCELIMYYNDKGIPFHRDMTFSREGNYLDKKNSQVENTPVVILVVGDTRELEFALHDYDGYRQQDKPKIIKLSHGMVFLLHPSDEKDSLRIIKGENCVSHFRHKSKGVKGRKGSLSIGFVFRCTKSRQLVNKLTGQYILNKTEKSEREMIFDQELEDYFADSSLKEYHEQFLKELYIDMRDKYIIKK